MARIEMSTTIGDLLSFYRQEHRIFGRCPNCGKGFRLSEAKLTYGKELPRDILIGLKKERDLLQQKLDTLTSQIEDMEGDHESDINNMEVDYENEKDAMQSDHEHELDKIKQHFKDKMDQEVQRELKKQVKEIRQDAIARSRVTTLGRTIERIAPMFSGFGHNPADVRPLFEPIDFVVFKGLFSGEVTDVIFVEFKTGQSQLNTTQRSIRNAVARKRVHFEEARMTKQMLKMLETGKRPAAIEVRRSR